MAPSSAPIEISRSSPPGSNKSNLTSQLEAVSSDQYQNHPRLFSNGGGNGLQPDSYSYSNSFSKSRPINMNGKSSRKPSQQAGSFMGGMSWGGMSVGSFIRDDVLMGTSPYNFQSPSFQSSSYLPKMEANFMKDYGCCGLTLDSMHELLQHYEEAHAGVPTQTMGRTPREQQAYNDARPQQNADAAALIQQQQQQMRDESQGADLYQVISNSSLGGQEMDDLDAMELDDSSSGSAPSVQLPQSTQQHQHHHQHQFQPQPQFGRQQPRMPILNTGLANGLSSNNRASTPSTPQPSQSFASLSTPTVGTMSSNMPTSPSDYDDIDTPRAGQGENSFDFMGLGMSQLPDGTTIDDPAKLLSSRNFGIDNLAGFTSQSDVAKKIRETQISAGMDPTAFNFSTDDIKSWRCPVIGCEKAYKNANGLKYHKQHGHQSQQLTENSDGTYSIVDPLTCVPYPGIAGMEKEKPYACEVCRKRYKNLNGLKYHRQHSPPCNPELKLNFPGTVSGGIVGGLPMMTGGISGLGGFGGLGVDVGVNVAGAGLLSDDYTM